MDRLKAMEVFARVVELGSFTAAAHALGLPKASATTHVQQLEQHLGTTLLHRTTRRVSTTPEGAIFHEEASRLLRELGELELGLKQATASPRGRLRVDVPAASGHYLLAPALPEFLARHPHLTVELGSSDRLVDLRAEGIDCVVRGGEVHDDSLIARRLGDLPVVTCAAPAYLKKYGRPASPDALDGHVFVNFIAAKTGRPFEVDWKKDGVEVVRRPPHLVAATDSETWIALAVAGLGIVQAPAGKEMRRLVRAGALVPLFSEWTSEPLPSWVLYPRTHKLPARVRVFIDWMVEIHAAETQAADAFVAGLARRRARRQRKG